MWRSINETNYNQTHIFLKQKVACSQSCGIHNKISAALIFETTNGIFSSFEIDGLENLNNIFKSNHAYDQNGKEYNKETLEGQCTKTRREFKESSTQVVSESDPNKSLSFLSSHSHTTSDLTTALKDLIPLRILEDDYRRFYPFKSTSFQSCHSAANGTRLAPKTQTKKAVFFI